MDLSIIMLIHNSFKYDVGGWISQTSDNLGYPIGLLQSYIFPSSNVRYKSQLQIELKIQLEEPELLVQRLLQYGTYWKKPQLQAQPFQNFWWLPFYISKIHIYQPRYMQIIWMDSQISLVLLNESSGPDLLYSASIEVLY